MKTEADPAKMVNELPLVESENLNPVFTKFCDDGIKHFESSED